MLLRVDLGALGRVHDPVRVVGPHPVEAEAGQAAGVAGVEQRPLLPGRQVRTRRCASCAAACPSDCGPMTARVLQADAAGALRASAPAPARTRAARPAGAARAQALGCRRAGVATAGRTPPGAPRARRTRSGIASGAAAGGRPDHSTVGRGDHRHHVDDQLLAAVTAEAALGRMVAECKDDVRVDARAACRDHAPAVANTAELELHLVRCGRRRRCGPTRSRRRARRRGRRPTRRAGTARRRRARGARRRRSTGRCRARRRAAPAGR